MKLLIEIPDYKYRDIKDIDMTKVRTINERCAFTAIRNGQPLPPNTMILDKDKLERDTEWDDFYDGFMSYSRLALEAAEIKEQTE